MTIVFYGKIIHANVCSVTYRRGFTRPGICSSELWEVQKVVRFMLDVKETYGINVHMSNVVQNLSGESFVFFSNVKVTCKGEMFLITYCNESRRDL